MTLNCSGRKHDPSDDTYEVVQRLSRFIRHTSTTVAPAITGQRGFADGSGYAMTSFTLTAGDANQYARELPVIERWLDPAESTPWAYGSAPDGGSISAPATITDTPCDTPSFLPIYDPLHPGVTAPPAPPGIAWNTWVAPTTWTRRRLVLPASMVPAWSSVLPVFRFAAVTAEARNVRIRIYRDPDNTGDMDPTRPCDFISDFVVTFVPVGSALVLDASEQAIYVESNTTDARLADSLVFSTDGGPFVWPELTLGVQHVIMLDLDPAQTAPYIDMGLVERFG